MSSKFLLWAIRFFIAVGLLMTQPWARAAAASGIPTHDELKAMFRAIDTSDNAAIDEPEWQAASRRLFDLLDVNRDGTLDEIELAHDTRLLAAYPKLTPLRRPISRPEFLAMRLRLFFGGDIDHDGFVEMVEYEILVLARRSDWKDHNLDDRINMSELREIVRGAFRLLDIDRNGWLSVDETPFLSPRERTEMDPHQTGRISEEQLLNGYRWLLRADTSNKNRTAERT